MAALSSQGDIRPGRPGRVRRTTSPTARAPSPTRAAGQSRQLCDGLAWRSESQAAAPRSSDQADGQPTVGTLSAHPRAPRLHSLVTDQTCEAKVQRQGNTPMGVEYMPMPCCHAATKPPRTQSTQPARWFPTCAVAAMPCPAMSTELWISSVRLSHPEALIISSVRLSHPEALIRVVA